MNPRIAELALQAGLSHMPSNYPDMADLYKGADFELEKFAELIVRECMDVLDPGENQLIARFQARQWLAEHFGIEG